MRRNEIEKTVDMKKLANYLLAFLLIPIGMNQMNAQCNIPYPGSGPQCTIYNACNYLNVCDPGACATCDVGTMCDMACTPIDSGVLFLLIGGGLFGAYLLMDRRKKLELIQEKA